MAWCGEVCGCEWIALDVGVEEVGGYEATDFEYGDTVHVAYRDRPKDMDEAETERFLDVIWRMLDLEPDKRPDSSSLLEHERFRKRD